MAATIKDIAAKLNVSVSTVSYALNGGPKPVSNYIVERVHEAAKELGYRPNRVARSLVTRRTHTIGVVPADLEHNILLTPCIHLALNGIFNAAEKFGQDVLVFTGHDRNIEGGMAGDLLDSRVDGVVFIAPRRDSGALKRISDSGLPFAVVAAVEQGGPGFVTDNRAGTEMALQHLFDLGHRRIAHLAGNPKMEDAQTRLESYRQFMSARELEPVEINGDYRRTGGYEAGLEFSRRARHPTAVYCANDDMAFGVIDAFRECGIRVPDEVSVVGFDDAPIAPNFHPPLTTVRQPLELMAEQALSAVVDQIESDMPVRGMLFPPELVVRGSTATVYNEMIR